MSNPGFAQDDLESLARRVGETLAERGWRLATAESCTGGWIAQCMTAIAGSSAWFESGLVTYSNAAKIAFAGVEPMIIETHGAVSGETAQAMAAGVQRATGAECTIAVTGVAGPGGGSAEKPVGLVWFGFTVQGRAPWQVKMTFDGDRRQVRAAAVAFALEELRGALA